MPNRNSNRYRDFREASQRPRYPVPEPRDPQGGGDSDYYWDALHGWVPSDMTYSHPDDPEIIKKYFKGSTPTGPPPSGPRKRIPSEGAGSPYRRLIPGVEYGGGDGVKYGGEDTEGYDIPDPEWIDPDDYSFFKDWKKNLRGAYEESYDISTDEIWKLQEDFGIDPAIALGGEYGGGAYTLAGGRYGPSLDFALNVNDPYKRYAAKHGYNKDLFDARLAREEMDMGREEIDMRWMESLGLGDLLRMLLGQSMGGE